MLPGRIITKLGVKHCFSNRRKARYSLRGTHGHGEVSAKEKNGLSVRQDLLGSLYSQIVDGARSGELGNPVSFLYVSMIVDLHFFVYRGALLLHCVLVG